MPTKIYWIQEINNSAKIGIMPRPRGGDWLEDEINHLKNSKVGVLISLLEKEEVDELELGLEKKLCQEKDIIYLNFPIADRGIPKKSNELEELLETLAGKLTEGLSVAVHCRMGIGRSSIIAASVLIKYNFKVKDIIDKIVSARGLKVPDTDEQLAWLKARE